MLKKLETALPLISSYLDDAHALSIIQTEEKTLEWFYSNYIQLVFCGKQNYPMPLQFFKVDLFADACSQNINPWLDFKSLSKELLCAYELPLINFLIKSIDSGRYVRIYLDEYDLPYSKPYKKYHFIHDTLIYGYDTDNQKIFGKAYLNKTKYFQDFEVDYKDIDNAFNSEYYDEYNTTQRQIWLLKMRPHSYYNFNKALVLERIDDYLASYPTINRYKDCFSPEQDTAYGISCYAKLREYLRSENVSIIPFCLLMEHKDVMLKRYHYMLENEYINENEDVSKALTHIAEKAGQAKNLFMKHMMSKTSYLPKISEILTDIEEKERPALQKLRSLIANQNARGIYSKFVITWDEQVYKPGKKLEDTADISFDLRIINDKAIGYFGFTNDLLGPAYDVPIYIWVDCKESALHLTDGDDNLCVPDFSLKRNLALHIEYKIDFNLKKYDVKIKGEDSCVQKNGLNFRRGKNELTYINQFPIFHFNSYRYCISQIRWDN